MQPLNIPVTHGGITEAVIRNLPIITQPEPIIRIMSDEAELLQDVRMLLVDIPWGRAVKNPYHGQT